MSIPTPDPAPPKAFDWKAFLLAYSGPLALVLAIIVGLVVVYGRLPVPPVPAPDVPISLPAEIKIDPADPLGELHAETMTGLEATWLVPPNCHVKTRGIDGSTLLLIGTKTGTSYVGAMTFSKGKAFIVWCKVTVGTPVPPVPPVPPTPPVPPVPPTPPAPIPDAGLHVLVVYETEQVTKLPNSQAVILTSTIVRDYLSSKCAKDGATPCFRFFDKDVDASGDQKWLQDALKLPRTTLPWIIVSDGKTGFAGPLPLTVDDTLALLKKIGG